MSSGFQIWSDLQALTNQHEQTERSACGGSAIANVLRALGEFPSPDQLQKIAVNQRIPESEAARTTLLAYLKSRSVAGMNAAEMITNIEIVSNNRVSGRHFRLDRSVDLVEWLAGWLKKGCAASALMNLQRTVNEDGSVPDAWHHQMIYGCMGGKVMLTNPVEHKRVDVLMEEVCCESVLLVRWSDVALRVGANRRASVAEMEAGMEAKWEEMNVRGQVVQVVEAVDSGQVDAEDLSRRHIKIPASYIPGITLFAHQDSPLFAEIINTPQQAQNMTH